MATLNSKFEQFRQAIEITDAQRNAIINSHTYLRNDVLQILPFVKETFLTGSYKRSTLIRPVNDVDMFAVLTYTLANTPTPQTILNNIKTKLQVEYPNSKIMQDRPCVTAAFSHCAFEITPVIAEEKASFFGGKYFVYYLPDMRDLTRWIKIDDPTLLQNKLSTRNAATSGMLVRVIKMMKRWKKFNNIRNFKSYQLEELVINLSHSIPAYEINSYKYWVVQCLRECGFISFSDTGKLYRLSDEDFAIYCRNTLFGADFPI